MTDGILLAETQTDPLLLAYDTLIIDEAHERSLNIDFLLGYLRQILPRRPDLKVIVTSATIDAQRFADHFASRARPAPGRPKPGDAPPGLSPAAPDQLLQLGTGRRDVASGIGPSSDDAQRAAPGREEARNAWGPLIPAPIIMVSGRMFPVEQRYRPFEESREYDLNCSIADGVDELWRDVHNAGDILVFLPGEREIREAAEHLRRHLSHQPLFRNAEVLPLFARLSQAEQDRIFDGHTGRRIVLATNVAETSLTVPGIRYVIDAGTARMKRYSFRSKVEQLLVEPISQSSANQRAGRCGRVANGICIRLYDQKDFDARPRFTDPEILRSSLAGVILRMKSLHMGLVEDFPFIERPSGRAIADGYQLLAELGAVDEANELTAMGSELARLPLDPRVGRMILEARERGALDEVLVIASALSVQDVRDRPMEMQTQADQAHVKFDDEKSEFSGYLKLWKWLEDARGGSPSVQASPRARGGNAAADPTERKLPPLPHAGEGRGEGAHSHKLSNRQYEQLLRQNFVNIRRVREWRDIHSQLHTVVAEHKWRLNSLPASYEQLHLSMLSGLLGNLGYKAEAEGPQGEYLGARGIKFFAHPGAHLAKKPGRWIVAAELVETTRLFGRGIAGIEPQWLEQVAGHLLKKQLLDPHWEKKAAEVIALERATLYGLVIYSGRRINYGRVDERAAREIFIREALIAEQWETPLPFLAANHTLLRQVEELEHKSRRQDVLVDEELIFAFYDQQLPADVCSGYSLERWYQGEVKRQPRLLQLTREELMRHEAAGITSSAFPKTIRLGGVDCKATYLHEPGDAKDGLTAEVPLFVLNQVNEERCEWLVPGMLKDKIQALLKSLPQRSRGRFVPLPQSAARLAEELGTPERYGHGALTDALLKTVRDETSLGILRNDFKLDMLSAHLFMNFRILDEHGRQLGTGRNLGALKAELGAQARGAFQALAGLKLGAATGLSQATDASSFPSASGRAQGEGLTTARPQPNLLPRAGEGVGTQKTAAVAEQRYTAWTFGELPELMEIRKGAQLLIGFPALVDGGDAVTIEVFDEPEIASAKHRAGLRRLVALQIRDALKYLEKNLPDLQKMAVAYMTVGRAADGTGGGSLEELRELIIALALDRAFLLEPLPANEAGFKRRVEEGRGRLTLIASEVARLASGILGEYALAARKIKDTKGFPDAVADTAQQLQRLMPKRFLASTPWSQLQHFARYLKAIPLRLDKLRADPARDAAKAAELKPLE
ncbi:MAG: DUF3418 domain-containing protein, partial [Betaproteobacteria bacterium]